MPLNKKQLSRLLRLVAMLKENRYPNCTSFARQMHQADLNENRNLVCTPKTIQRDVAVLRNDFGAPIAFDYHRNGYYLTCRDWDFPCPPIFSDGCLLAAAVGVSVARHIFPPEIREKLHAAVDFFRAESRRGSGGSFAADSLAVVPAETARIAPEIFMPLFRGWRNHAVCRIRFRRGGKIFRKEFEPHVLAYVGGVWHAGGVERGRRDVVAVALTEIDAVSVTDETFVPEPESVWRQIDGVLAGVHGK